VRVKKITPSPNPSPAKGRGKIKKFIKKSNIYRIWVE